MEKTNVRGHQQLTLPGMEGIKGAVSPAAGGDRLHPKTEALINNMRPLGARHEEAIAKFATLHSAYMSTPAHRRTDTMQRNLDTARDGVAQIPVRDTDGPQVSSKKFVREPLSLINNPDTRTKPTEAQRMAETGTGQLENDTWDPTPEKSGSTSKFKPVPSMASNTGPVKGGKRLPEPVDNRTLPMSRRNAMDAARTAAAKDIPEPVGLTTGGPTKSAAGDVREGVQIPGLTARADLEFSPVQSTTINKKDPVAPRKASGVGPGEIRARISAEKGMGARVSASSAVASRPRMSGKGRDVFTSIDQYIKGEPHDPSRANIEDPTQGGTGTYADTLKDKVLTQRHAAMEEAVPSANVGIPDHPANEHLSRVAMEHFGGETHEYEAGRIFIARAHHLAGLLGTNPSRLEPQHLAEVAESVRKSGFTFSPNVEEARKQREVATETRHETINAIQMGSAATTLEEAKVRLDAARDITFQSPLDPKPRRALLPGRDAGDRQAFPKEEGDVPTPSSSSLPPHLRTPEFKMAEHPAPSVPTKATTFSASEAPKGRAAQMLDKNAVLSEPTQSDYSQAGSGGEVGGETGRKEHFYGALEGSRLTPQAEEKAEQDVEIGVAKSRSRSARARVSAALSVGEDASEALADVEGSGASSAPERLVKGQTVGKGQSAVTQKQAAANLSREESFLKEMARPVTETNFATGETVTVPGPAVAQKQRERAREGAKAKMMASAKNASVAGNIYLAEAAGAKGDQSLPSPIPLTKVALSESEQKKQKEAQKRLAEFETKRKAEAEAVSTAAPPTTSGPIVSGTQAREESRARVAEVREKALKEGKITQLPDVRPSDSRKPRDARVVGSAQGVVSQKRVDSAAATTQTKAAQQSPEDRSIAENEIVRRKAGLAPDASLDSHVDKYQSEKKAASAAKRAATRKSTAAKKAAAKKAS